MNGLGQIGIPQQQLTQQGQGLGSLTPQRNSSLEMFELANAERMKAREMKLENEAMKAKAEQQMLQAERGAIVDNQILSALKNGQIDEKTAFNIFGDRNISQDVKQKVAQVMYPLTEQVREVPTSQEILDFYRKDGAKIGDKYFIPDEERMIAEQEMARAIGKPGNMNMNWN